MPQVNAAGRQRRAAYGQMVFESAGPEGRTTVDRCLVGFVAGPPMIPGSYNNNMQIVQTKDQIISNIKLSDEYKNLQNSSTPTVQTTTGGSTNNNVTVTPVSGSNNNNNNVITTGSNNNNNTSSGTNYGGGTAATNYISNQTANDADQATEAAKITHSTSANVSGQADAYLNAYANLTATDNQTAADTIAQTKAVTDATTKGAIASQQQSTVDDWLTDFYTEHGINQGKVDQGGRDYWTKQLGSKDKATVERDIL